MLKGIWIVERSGPCLYKLVADQRFLKIDENLFSGFFVALQAFAKTIGSEEVEQLVMNNISFSFMSRPNAVVVAAAEKEIDVSPVLRKVGQIFDEIFRGAETTPYNPLIPSDLDNIERKITNSIRDIMTPTQVPAREISEAREAGLIPRIQKPLTGLLRRSSKERQVLVERFGMISIDVLQYVNGKRTVDQIIAESGLSRARIEEILDFAAELGVVSLG
jgi:hypothetical protein